MCAVKLHCLLNSLLHFGQRNTFFDVVDGVIASVGIADLDVVASVEIADDDVVAIADLDLVTL